MQPPVRFVDDVKSGNDVSMDGRGRRNASDAKMLARDDARVITAEAQILLAGDEAVELRKQERSSEVSAMLAACSVRSIWKARCAAEEDSSAAREEKSDMRSKKWRFVRQAGATALSKVATITTTCQKKSA